MKKLSTILLSSLFLSPLVACGDDGDGDDTAGSTGPTGTGTDTGTAGTTTGTTTATTTSGTTGTSTDTGDDTTTGDETETGTDTEADTETGTETGTGTDTEAATETGTETGTGTDTEGTDPGYPMCMYSCDEDDDCLISDMDFGYTCEDSECVCTGDSCMIPEPVTCEEDIECQSSTWEPCSDEVTCSGACVMVGEEELCAPSVPSAYVTCETLLATEIELEDAEGNPVAVCVQGFSVCRDVEGTMQCRTPLCTEEGQECTEGFICDEESGNCLSCLEDSDCDDGDYCSSGSCMTPCEDPEEDCTPPFDGATAACG